MGALVSTLSVQSVNVVASRKAIARTIVPSEIDILTVSGFHLPGDKGAGALYIRGDTNGPMPLKDAEGSWWSLCAGSEVWAGWFGVLGQGDDTVAMQRAIDHVAAQPSGGTVRLSAGTYLIGKMGGVTELNNGETEGRADSDTVDRQAYCLSLPDNVVIVGEAGAVLTGTYTYGNAGLNELVCIACTQSQLVQNIRVSNITFSRHFIAIGVFKALTMVLSHFDNLSFHDCAIGLYSRGLERCFFDQIVGQGTGALIVVGGHWATRDDNYNEGGGFCDKTFFGPIHNIYQRLFGSPENTIDEYFDTYFFKTRNNSLMRGSVIGHTSVAARFPYRGICGRAVYLMARHGRPHNANRFVLVSHALAPRAAVWIDAAVACVGDLIYLEGCGYRDNVKHLDPIGATCTDPYLGTGVRVPAFVRGIMCTIDANSVYAYALNPGNKYPELTFACDLVVKQ